MEAYGSIWEHMEAYRAYGSTWAHLVAFGRIGAPSLSICPTIPTRVANGTAGWQLFREEATLTPFVGILLTNRAVCIGG